MPLPLELQGFRVRPTRREVHHLNCVDHQDVEEKGIEEVDTRRALAADCRAQFEPRVQIALADYLRGLPRRKDVAGDDTLTGWGEVAGIANNLVRDAASAISEQLERRAERKAVEQTARDAWHAEATRSSQAQVARATDSLRFAMLRFFVAWRTPEEDLPRSTQDAIAERRHRIENKNWLVTSRGVIARIAAALRLGGEDI
jgi:hypothetical protein